MRRYSWTKTTMVVAEVGGAYVSHADHLRAMAAKDAEIAALRTKVFQLPETEYFGDSWSGDYAYARDTLVDALEEQGFKVVER